MRTGCASPSPSPCRMIASPSRTPSQSKLASTVKASGVMKLSVTRSPPPAPSHSSPPPGWPQPAIRAVASARRKPAFSGRLLVLDLVEHEAVLDLVQDVHRLSHRIGLSLFHRVELSGGVFDHPVDCVTERRRQLALVGQIEHLQLVQELVDVMHPLAAAVLHLPKPAIAR